MPEDKNSDIKLLMADKSVKMVLWIFVLFTVLVFAGFYFLKPILAENPAYVQNGMRVAQEHGIIGLFIIVFLAETILPLPPQPVVGALAVLDVSRIALMVAVATFASLLGNLTTFYLARHLRGKFVYKYVDKSTIDAFDRVWLKRGDIILIICSVIPVLPGNIVAFVSGLSAMKTTRFSLIIVAGRGLMFVLVILMALKLAGSWFPWVFGMQ